MASETIKGTNYESYIVDGSDDTYKLDKNAFIHYGDPAIELPVPPEDPAEPLNFSLGFGYGILEDIASAPDISGNTYKIDGKLTGLFGGIATYGEGTKIALGKTADVNAQLGIGIGSITEAPDLSDLSFGTIFAGGHNSKVTIARGAEVGGLFGVTVTGNGSSVKNSGEMDNALVGIMSGGFNLAGAGLPLGATAMAAGSAATTTKLTNNGSIEAGVGIVGFGGDNQVITNGKKGEIEGLVGMIGGLLPIGEMPEDFGTLKMKNSGDIIAAVGMLGIISPNMTLTNAKGAEIIAGAIGMGAVTIPGAFEELDSSTTITNAGTIRVTLGFNLDDLPEEMGGSLMGLMPAAIFGGAGDENVVNTGKIYGDVVLGEGADTFTMKSGLLDGVILFGEGDDTLDFAGGKIKDSVYGGAGDDTYIITKAVPTIVELADEGTDTVQSAVDYTLGDNIENLTLTGKKDIDATGNGLDNVLTGNEGDNLLTGGAGLDIFVFGTKGGTDTIADFVSGEDKIDLSGWAAISDFATLQEMATDVGGSVQIKAGNDVLVIEGVLEAALVETDFNFAIV